MNLIEKLGGYENAKAKFRDNGSLHAERLKTALLEYRRANNIFEVGDVACYKNHINSSNTLFKFFHNDEYLDIIHILRHATPQEIEAGHRL